jgi:hypothetical protein
LYFGRKLSVSLCVFRALQHEFKLIVIKDTLIFDVKALPMGTNAK